MAKKRSKALESQVRLFRDHSPHRSFKRTYREDYARELNVPGMGQHIYESFRMILKNWKLFVPLIGIAAGLEMLAIGAAVETTAVFTVLIFLMVWLTTIFLVRQIKAKHKVGLRDGLYNSMTPLVSTLVVFVAVVVECMPIILLMFAYSAAVKTDFLTLPFYAFLFLMFAVAMIVLSGYLLSSSLIALVAVSAPGLYPWKALTTASELMMGRRIRFILRLIALVMVLGVICSAVLLPLVALRAPVVVTSVVIAVMFGFSSVYLTIYLYLYYRWMLKA